MSAYMCPKCKEENNLAIERRPDGSITCLRCKFSGKHVQFMDREHQLEEVILKWQRKWMDVQGTDEQDRKNYFERSAGIDANMRFSLARMIDEWIKKEIGA